MEVHDKILGLLVSFLGDYGKECGGWHSFNCPYCAEEKMVSADGHYNLEVMIDPDSRGFGGFHCWRCGEYSGMKGRLSSLVKRYGGEEVFAEFRRIVDEYRESRRYEIAFADEEPEVEPEDIEPPACMRPLRKDDPGAADAYAYVIRRGLDERIIRRYRLGYVGKNCPERQMRQRVFFPSYDAFGSLNYWTGRDYTGENKQKAKNPKQSKTTIVFNEYLINWYEPVTLVEGPFDHVVTPNSIPLLGKTMDGDCAVYKALVNRARCGVNIFLDDDAEREAFGIYSMLSATRLNGSVRMVDASNGHDASDIYLEYGPKGILDLLHSAHEVSDYDIEAKRNGWR